MLYDLIVAGGGAAGFFAAIQAASMKPDAKILICEKGNELLGKVKISGGGRCNVTHHCLNPKELILNYPRGGKSLLNGFSRFGPAETITWFEEHGVELKIEADGRMFPVTDNSETIVQCLLQTASSLNIAWRSRCGIVDFIYNDEKEYWEINTGTSESLITRNLLLATGSSKAIWKQLKSMDIAIEEPVPSLFTFHCDTLRSFQLEGLSVELCEVSMQGSKYISSGPFLITHWGFSGPAILKLSAFEALSMAKANYQFKLNINFLPAYNRESLFEELSVIRAANAKKQIATFSPFSAIAKRLWATLLTLANIQHDINWADSSNKQLYTLSTIITHSEFPVKGKSTFKDEFVTAGGILLSEIDLKSMQIKKYKGLFAAGEILNVDAITGGFNFQHAWTSGWIAGCHIAKSDI